MSATSTLDGVLLDDLPMAQERRKIRKKARFGFLWVTGAFFAVSLVGHWVAGWFTFVSDQRQHQQPVEVSEFIMTMTRDTLENWQSEFLQLMWQVAGLAWLLHIGSPQSREGDDRKEEKLDLIIKRLYPDEAERIFARLNESYPRS